MATIDTLENSFAPKLTYIYNFIIAVKLERNCLKQDQESFTHRNIVHVFIVYKPVLILNIIWIRFKCTFSNFKFWFR